MSLYGILAESLSLTSEVGWEGILSSRGVRSAAGARVTENAALTLSTCFACLNVIAGDIGKVPRKLFKTRPTGGRDPQPKHPVYDLLHSRPNPESLPSSFWGALAANAVFWGNGYASIERANNGTPIALWINHPSRTTPKRREDESLYYEVLMGAGQRKIVEAADMLHIPGLGTDGLVGWVVFQKAADTLGLGLTQLLYASSYLANGTAPAGVLETDSKLGDRGRDNISESWNKLWGGPDKAGSTPVLELGLKWKKVSVDPATAQLNESQQKLVADVCRFFRVSPHKAFDTTRAQGWATIDASQTEHVGDTLMPWFIKVEEACNLRLLTEKERADGYYVKNIVQALLRGDMRARGTYYRQMLMSAGLTPNEIRDLEDLNPGSPAGDKQLIPLQLGTLDDVVAGTTGKGASAPSPGRGGPGDTATAVAKALRPVFEETSRRLLRIEGDRIGRLASKAGDKGISAEDLASFFRKHDTNVLMAFAALAEDDGNAIALFGDLVAGFTSAGVREYGSCKGAAAIAACSVKRQESLPRRWAAQLLGVLAASAALEIDQPKEDHDATPN